MRRHLHFILLLLLIFAELLAWNYPLYAQSSNMEIPGKLIYVRYPTGVAPAEFVSLTGTSRQVFTVPSGKCTDISRGGAYTAATSMQRGDLIVRRLSTEEIVLQMQ